MVRRPRGTAALIAALVLAALPTAAGAAATSSVTGEDVLLVNVDDTATVVTVTCGGGDVKVNGADPGTGAFACGDVAGFEINGGLGADTIDLSAVTSADFPLADGAGIGGNGGNDTIVGTQLNDLILGGLGGDTIEGRGGDDSFLYDAGDGSDLVKGGAGGDNIVVVMSESADLMTVTAGPDGALVARTNLGPFTLDVRTTERIEVSALGGDDSVTGDDGLAALGVGLVLNGGDGEDTLVGGDGEDMFIGGQGDDTLSGGDGNDYFQYINGDGEDVFEGQGGDDSAFVATSSSGDAVTIAPDGDGVLVSRTNLGPFTLELGTIENLQVDTIEGDDTVTVTPLEGVDLSVDGGEEDDTDQLVVDAACAGATADEDSIDVAGRGDISHLEFEDVELQDATSIDPVAASHPAAGETGSVEIVTGDDCEWTVESSEPWLEITSDASGTGSATIEYTVAANDGAERTADVTVNELTAAITQEAGDGGDDSDDDEDDGGGGGCGCRAGADGGNGALLLVAAVLLLLRRRRRGAATAIVLAALLVGPAAADAAATSSVAAGALTVNIDADPTAVAITCSGGHVQVNGADPDSGQADCSAIQGIQVGGGNGGDTIDASGVLATDFTTLQSVTLDGNSGIDIITGSPGNDSIYGGPGNDSLSGGDGDDFFSYGPAGGSDLVQGGDGDDRLSVQGAATDEVFTIQNSADGVTVARTNVSLFSLDVRTIEKVVVNTLDGADSVTADSDVEVVLEVSGGLGADTLVGGRAGDTFRGGPGNDSMTGNGGADTFIYSDGDGTDLMAGGAEDDLLDITGSSMGDEISVAPGPDGMLLSRANLTPYTLDLRSIQEIELSGVAGDDTITVTASAGTRYVLDGSVEDDADTLVVDAACLGVPEGTSASPIAIDGVQEIEHEGFENVDIENDTRVDPALAEVDSEGGTASYELTTGEDCDWTVAASEDWVEITSDASGTGPATIEVDVAANDGALRLADITVNDVTFARVSQEAAAGAGGDADAAPDGDGDGDGDGDEDGDGGGCGCRAGARGGDAGLVLLVAAVLLRRRRRRG